MTSPFTQRLRHTLDRFGPRRALVCAATGRSLSFDDMEREARAMATGHAFARIAGRVTLLRLDNGLAWPVAFLALRHAGAVVVPVDADTPDAALPELAQRLRAVGILDAGGLRPTSIRAGARPRELLLGKLTSGSTGAPKAHFFTEAQMLADGDAVCAAMGIGPDDLNHAGLPFGHSYALGNLILPLFACGVPLSVASSHFPGVIAEEIARRSATVLPTVPALIAALHRSAIPPEKLASLRRVISAGARLDPADALAFSQKFSRRVHNFYGSSETGGIAFDTAGDDTLSGASVGRLMPGVSAERMRNGRLVISGPAVRTHGNPRRRSGWGAHPMTDLGRVDEDARVRLEGRLPSLIKIGGRRINPAEIERELLALPGVREAFVAAAPGPGGEPRLAALVSGGTSDPRALRAALRERLPAWKIPARLASLPAFPLTARGKADRAALIRLLEEES